MIRGKTEDGATLIAFLVDVLEGREPKAKVADRLKAARLLMDRLWGKPMQSLERSGPGGGPLQVSHGRRNLDSLTTEELRALASQREVLIQQRERLLAIMEAQGIQPLEAQQPPSLEGDAPDGG
jgi:hypothetical protein